MREVSGTGLYVAWNETSHPTVQQRDTWVVRVDGIDTVSGAWKPRQLGTFPRRADQRKPPPRQRHHERLKPAFWDAVVRGMAWWRACRRLA